MWSGSSKEKPGARRQEGRAGQGGAAGPGPFLGRFMQVVVDREDKSSVYINIEALVPHYSLRDKRFYRLLSNRIFFLKKWSEM